MIYHTYVLFSSTECQLFSAVVATHWNPDSTDSHSDLLNSHKCVSSWHTWNDISNQVSITASVPYNSNMETIRANDGFYCQFVNEFFYHSKVDIKGGAWMQIDLKSYFKLNCIR